VNELLDSYDPKFAAAIGSMKERLKKLTPSDVKYKDKAGNWTAERTKVHNRIISEYLNDVTIKKATPVGNVPPTYTMFGGRGGSGKGSFTKPTDKGGLHVVDENRVIKLDADEIKGKLPGYEGWNAFLYHEESSYLFDTITDMARDLRLNIVHDMTLKTTKTALKRAREFKSGGYNIEGYYMFLPPQEAAKRAISRFYTRDKDFSGRFVPPEVVLSNTKNEATFDALKEYFNRWYFYDNQGPRGSKPLLVGQGGNSSAEALSNLYL